MGRVSKETFRNAWIVSGCLGGLLGLYTIIAMYLPFIAPMIGERYILESGAVTSSAVINFTSYKTITEGMKLYLFSPLQIPGTDIYIMIDLIDMTLITLVAALYLPSKYYRRDYNYRNAVDDMLPTLLREISDAQKVGLPLPKAVIEASKHQYGALTEELRKMASKMSWGIGFQEALRTMSQNINTRLFHRTTVLILEAERAGGAIEDVFDAAHDHVSELLALKRQRQGSMKPYLWIIYMSYVIFLVVILLLLQSFFTNLALFGAEESAAASLPISLAFLQIIFFHLMMIEAFFSGIIAGKMSRGDSKIGLFHSMIMLIIGWFGFKLAVAAV